MPQLLDLEDKRAQFRNSQLEIRQTACEVLRFSARVSLTQCIAAHGESSIATAAKASIGGSGVGLDVLSDVLLPFNRSEGESIV